MKKAKSSHHEDYLECQGYLVRVVTTARKHMVSPVTTMISGPGEKKKKTSNLQSAVSSLFRDDQSPSSSDSGVKIGFVSSTLPHRDLNHAGSL